MRCLQVEYDTLQEPSRSEDDSQEEETSVNLSNDNSQEVR